MIRVNQALLTYISQLYKSDHYGAIELEKFPPGKQLIIQGKNVYSVYVLAGGIARCYHSQDNGKYFVQEFFGAGEMCGEIEAIQYTQSFSTVEAVNELQAYRLKVDSFRQLIREDKKLNELLLKTMAAKIRYKAERHAYNQSHTAEQNLTRLLSQYPQLHKELPKADIANYLGITLRSLNRILNDLAAKGLT